MKITEVLQFVDRIIHEQTGEHLNDLQKAIVQGLWQGKTYTDIADDCQYDANYIGDVSRKLFKDLSEQLDEEIKKSNFCWTVERAINSKVGLVNSNINWCSPHSPVNINQSIANEEETNKKRGFHDLSLAPKITRFCDRNAELQTISNWLTDGNTRLISILGLPGIGKTTLVKKLVDLNLERFDAVIWKNLKLSQSLDSIVTEILTVINVVSIIAENKLTQLINLLRDRKCLIILDDVQELFIEGKFSGQYKREYKDYKTLLAKMAEIEHQSCLILIGQEQCQEMLCLDEEIGAFKCLQLEGLDNTEILTDRGLKNEESWYDLINLYEGNPAYLQDIARVIKDIFGGEVSEFLRENNLLLTDSIQSRIEEFFERLSPREKKIFLELAKTDEPMSREDLRQALSLSSTDLVNGLQSLSKRFLIKPIKGETTSFQITSKVYRNWGRSQPA